MILIAHGIVIKLMMTRVWLFEWFLICLLATVASNPVSMSSVYVVASNPVSMYLQLLLAIQCLATTHMQQAAFNLD